MGIIPLRGRTIEVLSNEDIQAVHQAVLKLLKDPGIRIRHEEALDIFHRGGAEVDLKKQVVHIPPSLVEYALNLNPTNYSPDTIEIKSQSGSVITYRHPQNKLAADVTVTLQSTDDLMSSNWNTLATTSGGDHESLADTEWREVEMDTAATNTCFLRIQVTK